MRNGLREEDGRAVRVRVQSNSSSLISGIWPYTLNQVDRPFGPDHIALIFHGIAMLAPRVLNAKYTKAFLSMRKENVAIMRLAADRANTRRAATRDAVVLGTRSPRRLFTRGTKSTASGFAAAHRIVKRPRQLARLKVLLARRGT